MKEEKETRSQSSTIHAHARAVEKKKINTVHMAFIVAKSLKEPQWRKGYQE